MNKSAATRCTLLVLSSVWFLACDEDKASDYDEYTYWASSTADFSAYQTYSFEDIPEDVIEEAPDFAVNNHSSIKAIVEVELQALGLTEAAAGETPDLLVSSLAATDDVTAWYADCEAGWYWWGYWDSCAWVNVYPVTYDIGTVIIPVGDTSLDEVVFLGILTGIVDDSEDAQERITDGVHWIFTNGWPD